MQYKYFDAKKEQCEKNDIFHSEEKNKAKTRHFTLISITNPT